MKSSLETGKRTVVEMQQLNWESICSWLYILPISENSVRTNVIAAGRGRKLEAA